MNAGRPPESMLDRYFREIGDIPVLAREEERQLAIRLRGRRAKVQALLAGLPFTGDALIDRWRAGQGTTNPVRGLLARASQADPERAAHRLGAGVRRIEGRLRRKPSARGTSADEAAWERFESLQRSDLLDLDLSPDFYDELERAVLRKRDELKAAAGSGARRRIREEIGLPLPRFRRHMQELTALAAARDESRDELARHNLKLVARFAKEFRGLGVDFNDLIQEGNLGLLRAIDLFEPERGLKLSTYAMWWIRQALVRAIQKQARTVRLPSHVNERLYQLGRASDRLSGRLGRSPTNGELARETGLEPDRVEHMRALVKTPLSLDRDPDPNDSALHERLPDPSLASPLEQIDGERDHRVVGTLLTRLEPRERVVVGRRFGLSGEERITLDRLARDLELSREFVRRIEQKALAKLRGWAEACRSDDARGA